MSRLEKLIANLCPDGVEFGKLSDFANVDKGQQLNLTEMSDDESYPVMNGGINPSGYFNEFNTEENTITVSQGGASAGYVNFLTTKFWAGAHCYVVKPKSNGVINKFLYYLVKNSETRIQESKYGAGIPGLNKSTLEQLTIPLPPFPVQEEIVRILDTFTELGDELEAELAARTKQYEHYRNELLAFDSDSKIVEKLLADFCPDGVEYKKLGVVAVRTRGTHITAAEMETLDKPNAPVKIFAGGKTVAYFGYSDLPEKDVNTYPSVIVKSRGVIEFEYYDKPFSHKNELWSYHSERDDVDIKFLFYFLKTQEGKLRTKATSMGAFPQIAIPDTENLIVPLPPLPVQEEIVRILDRFDTLVNDLKTGLPAEIALRRKQYEYYRDKLLNFKPLE